MVKKVLYIFTIILFSVTTSWAQGEWEKQGNYYFLSKNDRKNFSAISAGANKFLSKYLTYEGVDFIVRGADDWNDYGRLDLSGNNLFLVPIPSGTKVEELHFLAGGNYGNSYVHDKLLSLYGDNYYYGLVTVIFAYSDGAYKALSVPVFWDWFHLSQVEWMKDGARIKYVGNNPVRKDCGLSHISFTNPRPTQPLKDILVTDSWLNDIPFSEIFALTLKSGDMIQAVPKEDKQFKINTIDADKTVTDSRIQWSFDNGLDGWVAGCSGNWDSEAAWQADAYGKNGVVVIPACNLGEDKFSWIEKKVVMPDWDSMKIKFFRHSAVYSEFAKQWTDGLLKVMIKSPGAQNTVYEKLYSGEWGTETADLSRYKGQTVIIRFENHGAGNVRLRQSTSSLCDAEDAIIDDISLVKDK
jgi:hypothetical protein